MKRFLMVLLLLWPGGVLAQSWPQYQDLFVNDYAQVIDEEVEARLRATLSQLRDETGVEATVLTLATRETYQPNVLLESFATVLFDEWGIGNAKTNDGILILVLRDDRQMRIELGRGYSSGYDRVAKNIIDDIFVPAFRDGDYSGGIDKGTMAVVERIARARVSGNEPISEAARKSRNQMLGALLGVAMASVMALLIFSRRIIDRFRRCPKCGKRGIRRQRKVLTKATRKAKGSGEQVLTCRSCGHAVRLAFIIPVISGTSSGGGSFGGGSSSGGGASGSW